MLTPICLCGIFKVYLTASTTMRVIRKFVECCPKREAVARARGAVLKAVICTAAARPTTKRLGPAGCCPRGQEMALVSSQLQPGQDVTYTALALDNDASEAGVRGMLPKKGGKGAPRGGSNRNLLSSSKVHNSEAGVRRVLPKKGGSGGKGAPRGG